MTRTGPPHRGLIPVSLAACVAFLAALAAPASAQEEARPATEPAAAAPEQPASRPAAERLGIRRGTHRASLFVGIIDAATVFDAQLLPPPITGEDHGMRAEMGSMTPVGVRYAYFFHERWGVELSLQQASTEVRNQRGFDRDEAAAILAESTLSEMEQTTILDRLELHAPPTDADLTLFDLGLTYACTPRKRWIAEVGGGVGWSTTSLSRPAVIEDLVTSEPQRDMDGTPLDPRVVANEVNDPTMGAGCPADDDPCRVLEDGDGITWHAQGGVSYAFTDHVHLRLGLRLRFFNRAVDPGDAFKHQEATVGVSFLWGGAS